MLVLEASLYGWEFTPEDIDSLKREFGDVAPLRASGGWQPAAGPTAEVTFVLTFLGGALAEFLLEKAFESTWSNVGAAWTRFRKSRQERGRSDPEFGGFIIRADDLEIQVTLHLDPSDRRVLDLMAVIADRLINGALHGLPIRMIALPCIQREDGSWERVEPEAYDLVGDTMVWWVEASVAEGPWGFYDAREDRWLE
jgi:hypothetical protein